MLPENMPYYRGLQIQPPADAAAVEASHAQTLLTATVTPASVSPNTLCIMRIRFGLYPNAAVYQAGPLPFCIETGKFLCEFYISHPSESSSTR